MLGVQYDEHEWALLPASILKDPELESDDIIVYLGLLLTCGKGKNRRGEISVVTGFDADSVDDGIACLAKRGWVKQEDGNLVPMNTKGGKMAEYAQTLDLKDWKPKEPAVEKLAKAGLVDGPKFDAPPPTDLAWERQKRDIAIATKGLKAVQAEDAKKAPVKKEKAPPNPEVKTVAAFWIEQFEKRTKQKPLWGAAEGAQAKRLLGSQKLETVKRCIEVYLTRKFWFNKDGGYDFKAFVHHYNEILGAVGKQASESGKEWLGKNDAKLAKVFKGGKHGKDEGGKGGA